VKKGGDVCYAIGGENRYNVIFGGGPAYPDPPLERRGAARGLRGVVRDRRARSGSRTVPAGEFFVLPDQDPTRENVLQPDEVLKEILVPATTGLEVGLLRGARAGRVRLAARGGGDRDPGRGRGREDARVVLGQVATIPWRSAAAEKALVGKPIDAATAEAAGKAAVEGAEPMTQNAYKVDLVTTLVRRTVASLA
jgi:xanthine dehydrogenase YagS FAD-binding subunit